MNSVTSMLRMLALNHLYSSDQLSSDSVMNSNPGNHGVYLHVMDALLLLNFQSIELTIMDDVKESNELFVQCNIHYKKPCIYWVGRGHHLIRVTTSSVLTFPPSSLPSLSPELPLLTCNASALYSVLFRVV